MNKSGYIHLATLEQITNYLDSVISQNRDSQHNEIWYALIQYDSSDFIPTIESIGIPKRYRKDISGILVLCQDGDYIAAWLTESNSPYWIYSHYRPLPFYRVRIPKYYPEYWQKSNPYYTMRKD